MLIDNPWALAALAGLGLFTGTINTMAGGGSLLTLPALILMGLPPAMANATNRVGIILQASVAAASFARAGQLNLDQILPRLISACAGAVVGASISLALEPEAFRQVIAVAMVTMLVVLVARPKSWLIPRKPAPLWVQILGYFTIGIYGGFLQAGVGIFILTGSALLAGEDLIRGNASKNFLTAAFNLPALALFVHQGLVAPVPGLCLAAGAMVGGWAGAKLAMYLGAGFVRGLLVVVVSVACSRLLGLW